MKISKNLAILSLEYEYLISLNIHLVKFVILQKKIFCDIMKSRVWNDFGGVKNHEFKCEK